LYFWNIGNRIKTIILVNSILIMKTIKRLILFLSFILTLTGCPPIPWADCFHNFIYQGTVKINDSISKENLVIRFDNLGDIIFNIQNRRLVDTSVISDNGSFKVEGDFFTTCASDKNIWVRVCLRLL